MAENTTVGPGGSTSSTLPITAHETLAHRDNTPGGSDENQTVSLPQSGELDMDQYPY